MKRQPAPRAWIARQVTDAGGHTLAVEVSYDRRLKRNVHWNVEGTVIRVRAPEHVPGAVLDRLLDDIVTDVLDARARALSRNDAELQRRAQAINEAYFDGALRWHTIRWAGNLHTRLGSCTHGGTTDGDIRISDQIKLWPDYVIDYVIAHELAHRKFPNHSPAFWAYLARYPHTERARGFIDGVYFTRGWTVDDPL